MTQHQQLPRQLVLLSASGAHILTTLNPVDQLKHLLQECGGTDSNAVREFFLSMSLVQACATALILAIDPNLQDTRVSASFSSLKNTTALNTYRDIQRENTSALYVSNWVQKHGSEATPFIAVYFSYKVTELEIA